MNKVSNQDYKLMERLVSLTQNGLKSSMLHYLRARYKKVINKKEYLVAIGNIPIALVAHMDTVFSSPVSTLYYDQRKNVMWSPDGLGADDRAGVFAIIKIIQSGLRPSIILTTDEECGGLGASALAEEKCPIPDLKYMIQLDRRGTNDCVFYDCGTTEFIDYVETFGFCEAFGSFSDISFLMPAWDICGTNLSVGYEDEHSKTETLHFNALYATIEKVKRMLQEENIPTFKYEDNMNSVYWTKLLAKYYNQTDVVPDGTISHGLWHCSHCKDKFPEYELYPVKGLDKTTKFYCTDCLIGNVIWCDRCGEAFETRNPNQKRCNDCLEATKNVQ